MAGINSKAGELMKTINSGEVKFNKSSVKN